MTHAAGSAGREHAFHLFFETRYAELTRLARLVTGEPIQNDQLEVVGAADTPTARHHDGRLGELRAGALCLGLALDHTGQLVAVLRRDRGLPDEVHASKLQDALLDYCAALTGVTIADERRQPQGR